MKKWAAVRLRVEVGYHSWTGIDFRKYESYIPVLEPEVIKLFDSKIEASDYLVKEYQPPSDPSSDEVMMVAEVKEGRR